MRDWYSPAELAGLPGMPGTRQATLAKAKREGWSSRRRAARGGGREYLLLDLPEATRTALFDQEGRNAAVLAAQRAAIAPATPDGEQWATIAALAGLPGMPGTPQGVRKALRNTRSRPRAKGKGREYPLSALPLVTRIALGAGVASPVAGSDADKTVAQRLWQEGHELLRGALAAQRQSLYAQLKRLLQVRDQGLLSDAELDAAVKDTVRVIEWARAQVERIEREAGSLVRQESGHE